MLYVAHWNQQSIRAIRKMGERDVVTETDVH